MEVVRCLDCFTVNILPKYKYLAALPDVVLLFLVANTSAIYHVQNSLKTVSIKKYIYGLSWRNRFFSYNK